MLGVMTAPGSKRNRQNVREFSRTSNRAKHLHVRFVLGDTACARLPTLVEAALHNDFAFVNSSDCHSWHRAAKVHAWYRYALDRWPQAHWIGKSEDDGMLRIAALQRDLGALDSRDSWYYGIMAWVGLCAFDESCADRDGPAACCMGGCFAGGLQPHPAERSACMDGQCRLPRCQPRTEPRGHRCARVLSAPFAIGPVEVRSAVLARMIAGCQVAHRYMDSLSAAGDAVRRDCSSMDGNQGLPLIHCAPRLRLADATWRRMSYPHSAIRNSQGRNSSVLGWTHPAKGMSPEAVRRLWAAYASLPYRPAPLQTYEYAAGGLRFTGTVQWAGHLYTAEPRARLGLEPRLETEVRVAFRGPGETRRKHVMTSRGSGMISQSVGHV